MVVDNKTVSHDRKQRSLAGLVHVFIDREYHVASPKHLSTRDAD